MGYNPFFVNSGGYTLLKTQTKKGASVTDCTNLAVMRQFNMSTIFDFDQVYAKTFGGRLEIASG